MTLYGIRRNFLKLEAQWEVEQSLRLSGQEVAVQIKQRNAWLLQVFCLFEWYDVLGLPSAQVFPFASGLHWPLEVAGWMEVVPPATLGGLPTLNVQPGW